MSSLKNHFRNTLDSLGLGRITRQVIVEAQRSGEYLQQLVRSTPAPEEAIIILGSGRGGTTWLHDILAKIPATQQIFEPLFPPYNPEVRQLTGWDSHLYWMRSYYLRPHEANSEWHELLNRILHGKYRNYWTDYQRTSFFPKRYLFKFVRANLMAGFIAHNFKPKLIFVMRHPCAVVLSRIKAKWQVSIDDMLSQDKLVADYLEPYLLEVERSRHNPLQIHAIWWALENHIARQHLFERTHYFITYETLSLKQEQAVNLIVNWLGLETPVFTQDTFIRGTRMTDKQVFDSDRANTILRLQNWQTQLDMKEQNTILAWAERFGLDDIYSLDPLPNSNIVEGHYNDR